MPGRAKITIDAQELKTFKPLINELMRKGYDISDNSQVKVTFLAPYQPKPSTNIKLLFDRLCRFISINGDKSVSKIELCKILGVSKPTLDDWIKKDWINVPPVGMYRGLHRGRSHEIRLEDIREQLKKMTLLCM